MEAVVWGKVNCPSCLYAATLLNSHGIIPEKRTIGDGWTKEQLLAVVPNARSVPQIFIDDVHIGGFPELEQYCKSLSSVIDIQ